jgi:hypothetical protein
LNIKILAKQYADADAQLKQLFKALGDIEAVAGHTPASVGKSAEWGATVNAAEENGANYCKALHGKTLSVPCTELIATLDELKASSLADKTNSPKATGQHKTQEDGFLADESAAAERKFETGHNIEFGNTTIQDKVPGYMDCLIKEAIKIKLHPRHSVSKHFKFWKEQKYGHGSQRNSEQY